ncbi:MAG TPA: cation transporter [Gemmatimonadaceae bacterium]|nr:cation transporter [Gemmatimonadaceae bacterium]
MERMKIDIEGMSCSHCVHAVKKALDAVQGVRVDDVQVGAAMVTFDAGVANENAIAEAIADEGYSVVDTKRWRESGG